MRRLETKVFNKDVNAGVYWYKIRNPFRIIVNGAVLSFAKYFPSMVVKRVLLRAVGIKVGKNACIAPSTLDPIFPELIELGENSMLGWGSVILTHEIIGSEFRKGNVTIGNNTTIGAGTLILPGLKIGKNVLVGAYSLVNKDVPDGDTVAGVPEGPIIPHNNIKVKRGRRAKR